MRKIVVGALALVAVSCSVFGSDDDGSGGGSPPVAPPGAQPPAPPPPPPLTGTPDQGEVNEEFGVFVAPGAPPDGADGSRAHPLGTLAAGLTQAVAQSKRLYVCLGVFHEQLKLAPGVPTVGGFDCSQPDWKVTTDRTRVESPVSPAMIAEDVSVDTRVEGFDVNAPSATEPGGTSIGLLANAAGRVTFVNTRIAAGDGAKGADGQEGLQLANGPDATGKGSGAENANASPPGVPGSVGRPLAGSAGGTNACAGAPGFAGEAGGKGGASGYYSCTQPVAQGGVTLYTWKTHVNDLGTVSYGPKAGEVRSAASGAAGPDGASASGQGTVTATGFTPSDGLPGGNGGGGHGGSGGTGGGMTSTLCTQSTYGNGASGPGGGAGGCPGLAGTPGKGGGASIAALLVASAGLTFDGCELAAGHGGEGGKGSFGSSPTVGGLSGGPTGAALAGSAGGPGGPAGVSGSGAGGASVAIAYQAGDPNVANGTKLLPGAPGAGVAQLTSTDALGNAKTIPPSVAGEAKDRLAF
jgi:hypothetical protein